MIDELRIEHYDDRSVDVVYDEMVPLYVETHQDLAGNSFYTAERFASFFVSQRAHDGFELLTARIGDKLVGVVFGFTEIPGEQFALCELMVSPAYQRQGIAKRLHDELLARRREPRADLYVRKDNAPAQAAYKKWGWTKIGDVQPTPEAPNFDELILTRKPSGALEAS
jgi:ribosomal protein S18 acetylase RimI-like enzyme